MPLVLFNLEIWPYQVLPCRARLDQGAMAMKGCSVFPKAPALLGPHHQIVSCHIKDTHLGGGLTHLQSCSRYILQPQATGQSKVCKFLSTFKGTWRCTKNLLQQPNQVTSTVITRFVRSLYLKVCKTAAGLKSHPREHMRRDSINSNDSYGSRDSNYLWRWSNPYHVYVYRWLKTQTKTAYDNSEVYVFMVIMQYHILTNRAGDKRGTHKSLSRKQNRIYITKDTMNL